MEHVLDSKIEKENKLSIRELFEDKNELLLYRGANSMPKNIID